MALLALVAQAGRFEWQTDRAFGILQDLKRIFKAKRSAAVDLKAATMQNFPFDVAEVASGPLFGGGAAKG